MTTSSTTAGRAIAGRYELLAPIGSGGMGTVWHGRDLLLRREVAVKEVAVHPGLPPEERATLVERTLREARAAATIQHPNVVTVYDVVSEDDRPWIVMALLDARSLAEIVKTSGPLPPQVVARIGLQLLDALSAAHQRGVLHRDVKPGNVLLGDGGQVTLTDFGVARNPAESPITSTGLLLGSPSYIAPERARGRNAGPPSDLFSLGATLYTAVEGRSPFDRGEPMETLTAVVSEPPTPYQLAGPLAPVLDRLMVKDPEQRAEVREARAGLERVAAGGQDARPAPPPEPPIGGATQMLPYAAGAAGAAGGASPYASGSPYAQANQSSYPQAPTGYEQSSPYAQGSPSYDDNSLASDLLGPPQDPYGQPADPYGQQDRYAAAPQYPPEYPPAPPQQHEPWRTGGDRRSGPERDKRTAILALGTAAVLVLVVVVVGIGSMFGGGGGKKHQHKAKKTGDGVPTGFVRYTDPHGFSTAVPQGWQQSQDGKTSTVVDFWDPTHEQLVRLETGTTTGARMLSVCEAAERHQTLAGYQRVKLDATPVAGHQNGCEWEFTWVSKNVTRHVMYHGFLQNGKYYTVYFSTPQNVWQAKQNILNTATRNLTVTQ